VGGGGQETLSDGKISFSTSRKKGKLKKEGTRSWTAYQAIFERGKIRAGYREKMEKGKWLKDIGYPVNHRGKKERLHYLCR